MAPVIRISEDLFRRLQAYSTPLVDTPSTVIERILDGFEAAHGTRGAASVPKPSVGPASHTSHVPSPNLFLAPGSGENLRATVENAVSADIVKAALTEPDLQRLTPILQPATHVRCWAMAESRRGVFSSMRPNDLVLFTETGSGRFSFRARVIGKVESKRLGEHLWRVVPGKPWSLIYFLADVARVSIPKQPLLRRLGFAPEYWVPGVIRVNPSKLAVAVKSFGSLEDFLSSARA